MTAAVLDAPETVDTTTPPRKRHLRCPRCTEQVCEDKPVALRPASLRSVRCPVCADPDVVQAHRWACKGETP